jgi:hypothetical protein
MLMGQTKYGKEFGIYNRYQHFNCFLNVLLQIIWGCRKLRLEMLRFVYEEDKDIREEPKNIQKLYPFIIELKNFYRAIDLNNRDQNCESGGEILNYESCGIRRELFKLHYETGEYALHEKADAFESFDFILEAVHNWMTRANPQSCLIT